MADDILKFDEDKCVAFIRGELTPEINERWTDDEILYVVDIIWDYYESKGLLSLDSSVTDEEELDIDKLVEYVTTQLKNDHEFVMDPDHIPLIVKGEIDYEQSLEDFI